MGWILPKIIKQISLSDLNPSFFSWQLEQVVSRSWQKEPLAVTKQAQGTEGAKNEVSICGNNSLVLSLQLFHPHFPLTHLLFYNYFAFSLPASLSQSCFPFSLFCLACISLSCHKSTLLETPKGFLPMASLCELCLFFLFNLQCSTLHCHWFNRPPWILLPVKQQHNYFEFYCGRAWHPALDHLTLFTLARVHLKIQDNVMCDSRMVFCGIVLIPYFRDWTIWQLMDKDSHLPESGNDPWNVEVITGC